MPCYNDLEIGDLPVDFFNLIEYRFYLDNVEDFLVQYDKIPDPPNYVKYTPTLFLDWSRWSKNFNPPEDWIRPFGEKIGPDWMLTEFKNLEDFYKQYQNLIEIEGD